MKSNLKKTAPEIIVALDLDDFSKAKLLVDKLYPEIRIFKIGLQAFINFGAKITEHINKKGAGVFLDLKFFDIPNTVANAVAASVRLRVKMLTLHISGGRAMIEAAVKARDMTSEKHAIKKPLLIGVTILTSQEALAEKVLELASQGLSWGLDGIVCSVKEVKFLRESIAGDFYIVTPGIRAHSDNRDDQKRTATIKEAVSAGSNFLVIGRPIVEAKNPVFAAKEMFSLMKTSQSDFLD